jgi:hypothetical protein
VQPTLAFGAGNIAGVSKIEGQNCELPHPFPPKPIASHCVADTFVCQGVTAISRMPFSGLPWLVWPAARSSTS